MASSTDDERSEVDMIVNQVTNHFNEVFTSKFKWKLEKYQTIPDSWLYTSKINIPRTRFYWMLQLNPNSKNPFANLKFHIGFHGDDIDSSFIDGLFYEIVISIEQTDPLYFKADTALSPIVLIDINDKLKRDKLDSYLVKGSLELDVKVCIKRTLLLKNVTYRFIDTLNQLSDNFRQALEDEEFKDVKFIVNQKEIPAHKVVLAARSPVFKKMFITNMTEAQTNHVVITDISHDIFEEMLFFIYTGKTSEKFSMFAIELLAAAHKYQIENLKKLCEAEISKNLTEENAGAVLKSANLFDCDEAMKKEALQLFKSQAYRRIGELELDHNWEWFDKKANHDN